MHEELVVLHSMAKEVEKLSEGFSLFETFKGELAGVLQKILETQNAMKQELFVIRNKQAGLIASEESDHTRNTQSSPANNTPYTYLLYHFAKCTASPFVLCVNCIFKKKLSAKI